MQFWNGMQRKTTMVGTDRIMVGDVLSGLPQYVTYSDFVALVGSSTNVGKSAYEIYTDVTTDNPIKSESEWIESLYGQPGQTPTIGSNGNWFIGTTDTGVKAQPENPVPVQQFYNGHHNAIELYVGLAENISPDYRLCNGNNGVPVNGVVIPDLRKFFLVGYDPNDADYSTIGKTGGLKEASLSLAQLPPHSFKTVIVGNNNESPLRNNSDASIVDIRDDRSDGNSDYSLDGKVGNPTLGKTNTLGGGQSHENRPPYYTVAYIIRVVPQVISGGVGSTVYQKKAVITTTDGVMNESTYIIEGTSVFALPFDFDFNHDSTFFDGALLTEPVLDPILKTATFTPVPLLGNKITIKYYPL